MVSYVFESNATSAGEKYPEDYNNERVDWTFRNNTHPYFVRLDCVYHHATAVRQLAHKIM